MKTQNPKDEEYVKIIRDFRVALAVSLITIIAGSVFYHIVEKLSWVDSVYLCVITLATVGYGDITPHTTAGKIFTIFYIIAGVGILAAFANLLVKRSVAGRRRK